MVLVAALEDRLTLRLQCCGCGGRYHFVQEPDNRPFCPACHSLDYVIEGRLVRKTM
jgi:hypothetical protein